ncbi:MAG: nucleoside hydrolase [Cyclobacteriaceae bacterium]
MNTKAVFLDHDGGVDDLLALLLLLCAEEARLLGVAVTPADCFGKYAVEASRKFLDLMGQSQVEVALSQARGINAFPDMWRAQPMVINAFPQLLRIAEPEAPLSTMEASDFIIQTLQLSPEPVCYLMTGPCTTLVNALRKQPTIAAKISEIVWMAGAVEVHGNVRSYAHDGSAEWNVYWDASSAQWLLQQNLPLTLVPLDATNQVPVDMAFLQTLARQDNFQVSALASSCWAITINTIPGYDYTYHMWDVLAAAYVFRPAFFEGEITELNISTQLPDEGRTMISKGSGGWARVIRKVRKVDFYQYLMQQVRRNFPG